MIGRSATVSPHDTPRAPRPNVSASARLLRLTPWLVATILLVPVLAGLAGTIAPAFHLTDPDGPSLAAFRDLAQWPGLQAAAGLSLLTGLVSTAVALLLTILITAALHQRPVFAVLRQTLAPLLAVPHAAAALGLAFLIAPSGWLARALSPWATGWTEPPDLLILNDPFGLALTFGLIAKELPFLLLVMLAALSQTDTTRRMQLARSLGYSDIAGFCLVVMPALYRPLRLPVLAVLSYAMTTVDMGLVLGPTRPPPLAVQITLWMTEPNLTATARAAAAAVLQLALTLTALALWRGVEVAMRHLATSLTLRGLRLRRLDHLRPLIRLALLGMTLTLLAAIAALALWSVAGLWPFPGAWPETLTLTHWTRAAATLTDLSLTTLAIASLATALAFALTLCLLQAEFLFALPPLPPALLYLPLILPQVCFLPGLEHLALRAGALGGLTSVTLAHLIFVLPYVYLSFAGPFRAWDRRIATLAATLGASPAKVFWCLRLPMLLAPLAVTLAIGLAVSIGQYLPTLLVGGGRVSTLTTEALALASGGNRRLTSTYAMLQTFWPMLGFALALGLPPLLKKARFARGRT